MIKDEKYAYACYIGLLFAYSSNLEKHVNTPGAGPT